MVSFTSLIDGYCKDGKLEVAYELFEKMSEVNLSNNGVTYAVLIDGFCKNGMLDKARVLFSKMLVEGPEAEPNSVYSSMISGCFKLGKTDGGSGLMLLHMVRLYQATARAVG